MHSLRPSPALVVALLALLLAAGGGAYAAVRATGSAVNIVDPTTATHVAKVSSGGSLQVTGSVNAAPTSSTNFVHGAAFDVNSSNGCETVLTPPSGRALIVTQVHVDTFADPTPGGGQLVALYLGNCSQIVDDVNPASVGSTSLSFEPGLGIPAGSELSVRAVGAVGAEVYAFGYTTSASSVPPVTGPTTEAPQQQP